MAETRQRMADGPAIVVGIDGGYASGAALELALREAELYGTCVRAVTCWTSTVPSDEDELVPCRSEAQAAELLEVVISTTWRRHLCAVHVVREIVEAPAGPALVEASSAARLLVLGTSARAPSGPRHGSRTLQHCLAAATPPVVVVPWTFDALASNPVVEVHRTSWGNRPQR